MRILIIEDEKIKRITLTDALLKAGHEVSSFDNPSEALIAFNEGGFDVVVTDLRLPQMGGLDLVEKIKGIKPDTEVIVMTAYATVDTAVRAMKLGAYDYITKPFSSEELILILERLDKFKNVVRENIKLKAEITSRYSFNNIIGKGKEMQEIYDLIRTIAPRDTTTLIIGESGTGKELIAHAIHYNSLRKDKPLIKLSCATLTESLLESELFGHEKGAFTGAIKDKKGRFELAHEGTIFLDDVDDIPISMQPKLLRVLQEREFERVGGIKTIKVDVRIICATKRDLLTKVKDGAFREDLFYRLNVVPVKLPPLRERKEDIPLLCGHFLSKYCKPQESRVFTNEAMKLMMDYDWPGNVRELENIVERVVAVSKKHEITLQDMPDTIVPSSQRVCDQHLVDVIDKDRSFDDIVIGLEKRLLSIALERSSGNKSEAARLLKMKRETLRDKIEKYGLNK
ncbi:MAG: sigma-54-dependent Fis family transcriptional regulator [Deltaproteobacteria bacterium]|nr:sigma-54-dependent Fis family transcriptional regulator [Deltaproteobacteria bacterium]